jgi:hypothetical protein
VARRTRDAETWDALTSLVAATGLRTWTTIVVAAIAVGTAGYMTVFGVTTVGFNEVRDLDASGSVWTMIMSGTGVVLVFGTVGIVTEHPITEATSGRGRARRMAKAVGELHDHCVLCGCGWVGSTVASETAQGRPRSALIDVSAAPAVRSRSALEEMHVSAGNALDRRLGAGETNTASGSAEAFRAARGDEPAGSRP